MKTLGRNVSVVALSLLLAGGVCAEIEKEEITFGIEYGGTLCGYSQFHLSTLEQDGEQLLVMKQKMYVMLQALGAQFNSQLDLTYHVEPATGRFVYHDSHIRQGEMDMGMRLTVENGVARMTSADGEEEYGKIEIPPHAVLPNTLWFPYLRDDFLNGDAKEKTYDVFEVREGAVQPATYTRAAEEMLEIRGKSYDTVVLVEENGRTGTKIRRWIDRASCRLVKMQQPNGMTFTLADRSILGRIEMVNVDSSLLTPTNLMIRDMPRIRYMRVKAVLEPSGLKPTPESLCVPGQTFEGTVEGNRIEGIFEISHPIYDGTDAPAFPLDWSKREDLQPFLLPADLIESDDPVLIEAALEIVEGATDSWDAACRISRWVTENIRGEMPGGGTARKTYDIRNGECGAHSYLTAALCRAAGIPCRAVWGCMYAPMNGGCFGQHAWNEVYMGDAGWIPIDTTVHEPDFVDSGHLRVGILQSRVTALNGISFEILDHILEEE